MHVIGVMHFLLLWLCIHVHSWHQLHAVLCMIWVTYLAHFFMVWFIRVLIQ
jgi:hypothetical protein